MGTLVARWVSSHEFWAQLFFNIVGGVALGLAGGWLNGLGWFAFGMIFVVSNKV